MSKSATSDRRQLSRAGVMAWQLAQVFWVGGLWLLHFVVLPALDRIGLAPLLVEMVAGSLRPLLVAFAGFCTLVQALLLIQAVGATSLWRDLRGQLLLMAMALSAVFLLTRLWAPTALFWLNFSYLLLAFCGLILVVQVAPSKAASGRAR
ncbi:DUF4149 domain-containing protein [Pseudomonas boanensis]|uniref:DUF4149 domain-containing protein n=1 Tax=Metapseudomonas boanensis TaxID=2822138 RepID=UPI0035D436DF